MRQSHALSDMQIKVRIVPRRLRWPESGTSIAWTKAHDCASAFDNLIRTVDIACAEVEEDPDISPAAIARHRAEIFDEATRKLANFAAFAVAERAMTKEIAAVEGLNYPDPKQSQMHEKLMQGLRDLREGLAATGRLLQERVRERASV
jgi:hypothetical protein